MTILHVQNLIYSNFALSNHSKMKQAHLIHIIHIVIYFHMNDVGNLTIHVIGDGNFMFLTFNTSIFTL